MRHRTRRLAQRQTARQDTFPQELTSSKRRLSESGNLSRFFPDARLGTNRGRSVHPVRAVDKSCACHELCAAHVSIALEWHRRADEQLVPDSGVDSVVWRQGRWKVRRLNRCSCHALLMTVRCSLGTLLPSSSSLTLLSLTDHLSSPSTHTVCRRVSIVLAGGGS